MGERGNRLLRIADRYAGIPLMAPAAIFRRLDRLRMGLRPVQTDSAIGIFCPGALGDAVLLSALLCGIRHEIPNAAIDFFGSAANAQVLPLLPHVRRAWAIPIKKAANIVKHARAGKYDIFIDASQWARIGAVVGACSGARRVIGFATPGQWRSFPYDVRVPHRNDCHEMENFLALGRALWPAVNGRPQLNVPAIAPSAKVAKTIFCHMWPAPGPGRALKQWPEEYWVRLMARLMEQGYEIALTGSAADAPHCQRFLLQYFPRELRIRSWAASMPLAELAANLKHCAAVFSVNTGIMHLAAAVGAPTIGLHGATNPLRWGPVGENTVSLLPRAGAKAYLHLGFEYPPRVEPAMRHLPVEDALEALERLTPMKGLGIARANWDSGAVRC